MPPTLSGIYLCIYTEQATDITIISPSDFEPDVSSHLYLLPRADPLIIIRPFFSGFHAALLRVRLHHLLGEIHDSLAAALCSPAGS